MHYYKQNKEEISQEEFIDSYGKSYYIDEQRLVKGTTQNSKYIEIEIDAFLEKENDNLLKKEI